MKINGGRDRTRTCGLLQDESYVLGALKAGAKGYLLKDSMRSEVVQAIRAVSQGRSFLTRKVARILPEDYVGQLQFGHPKTYPHLIRHCYATHWLEAGGDLLVLQKLMGHAKLEDTVKYLHLSRRHLLGVANPLDNLTVTSAHRLSSEMSSLGTSS